MEKLDVFETHREEYVFSGLRFLPNKWQIEVFESGNQISLTKIQREFLLTLLKTPNRLVSYDDLRRDVWSHEPEVDQRLIHNIHVAKSKLTNLLENNGIDSSFIETVDGEGYKINVEIDDSLVYQKMPDDGLQEELNAKTNAVTVNTSAIHSHLFLEASTRLKRFLLKRNLVFGLILTAALLGILWYYKILSEPKTGDSQSAENGNLKDIKAGKNISIPQIERIEIISAPAPKIEFYIYIAGNNFDPEIVRLKVIGPGCGGDNPCVVPNGALRLYGKVSETTIEKAPLTLGHGEYKIWLENRSGDISNQMTIFVPERL